MRIEQKSMSPYGQDISREIEQQRRIREGKERKLSEPAGQEKPASQLETQVRRGRRGEVVVMAGDDRTGAGRSDHNHGGPQDSGKPPASGGGGGGGDNNGPGRTGGDDFDPHGIKRGLRLLEGFANGDVPPELRRAATFLASEVRETIFVTRDAISETHFKRLAEIDQFVGTLPEASQARYVFRTLKVEVQHTLMNQDEPLSSILTSLASLQTAEIRLLARFDHQVQQVFIDRYPSMKGRLEELNANPERCEYTLKLHSRTQVLLFGRGGGSVEHWEKVVAGLDTLYASGQYNRDALLLLPPYAQEALLRACSYPWLPGQDTREVVAAIGQLHTVPTDQLRVYERMGNAIQLEVAVSLAGNPDVAKQRLAFLGQLSQAEVETLDRFAQQFDAIPMLAYIQEKPQRLPILEAITADCMAKGINYTPILTHLHWSVRNHVIDVMVGDATSSEKVAQVSTGFKNIEDEDSAAMFIRRAPPPSQFAIMESAHDKHEVSEKMFKIREVIFDRGLIRMWEVLEHTTDYALIQHPQFKELLHSFVYDESRLGKFIGLVDPEARIAFFKHRVEAQDALINLPLDLQTKRLQAITDMSSQEQSWWYRQHVMVHLFLFKEQHGEIDVRSYLRQLDASDQ